MIELTDTHTHLYLADYADDTDNAGHATGYGAVRRAIDAGVTRMIFPGVEPSGLAAMHALANEFPQNIYLATGLHPTEVGDNWRDDLATMMHALDGSRRYVAIGEVGIDLYWDTTYRDQQMQALEIQARRAAETGLPLILHCRNGLDCLLEVLSPIKGLRAVMHSFGGTPADVERVRSRAGDYYFGINGIVTFKKATVADTLPAIGLDRLLLETDAPWLAPTPLRGRRNESSFMVHTASFVADAMHLPVATVAAATNANATTLFGL